VTQRRSDRRAHSTAGPTDRDGRAGGNADGTGGQAGSGGSIALANAVGGSAPGGALTLTQYANGGNGGEGTGSNGTGGAAAGAGGTASSSLTFDDTLNGTPSNTLKGYSNATGGAGGGTGV
jgi:hypothetical protein